MHERQAHIMINVLYLINHAGKAGTEAYIKSLVDKLSVKPEAAVTDGIRPLLGYNEDGLLSKQLKDAGISVFKVKMRHPFDIIAAFKLAAYCRKMNVDIIHSQYLRENYIALFSRFFNPHVKVIYTNHFILNNNIILRVCNFFLSRLQAGIIAVCNPGRKMMEKNLVDPEKITVIFNGVDPMYWGTREVSTLKTEFGIKDNEIVLLCGSRFAYDKGHEYLVKAIAELKKIAEGRGFKFLLANDGPFLEARKQQVKEIGIEDVVIFTGQRKDIKNLYDGSDIYVNSSWHEALSFAIIEAMADGLPVVATRMGGNTDIIDDEYKNGILVEYGNEKELADVLLKLIENEELRAEIIANGHRAIQEKFNLDIMALKTYNLYKKTVTKGGKKDEQNK
jgi:glycosyltransferase involved in cell wall biosynthesis